MARRARGMCVGLAVVLVAVCGCGLFSVRDSEEPDEPLDIDPLGFSGLLRGTSENFDRLEYADIFADAFVYREGAGVDRGKADFVSRLRSVEGAHPAVLVEWTRQPGKDPLFSRVEGYRVVLDSVTYHVYINGDPIVTADYSGYADIGLVYAGYWAITYWHDFPNLLGSTVSFFNPDFAGQQ